MIYIGDETRKSCSVIPEPEKYQEVQCYNFTEFYGISFCQIVGYDFDPITSQNVFCRVSALREPINDTLIRELEEGLEKEVDPSKTTALQRVFSLTEEF